MRFSNCRSVWLGPCRKAPRGRRFTLLTVESHAFKREDVVSRLRICELCSPFLQHLRASCSCQRSDEPRSGRRGSTEEYGAPRCAGPYECRRPAPGEAPASRVTRRCKQPRLFILGDGAADIAALSGLTSGWIAAHSDACAEWRAKCPTSMFTVRAEAFSLAHSLIAGQRHRL
jgi:hypothetical protein